MLVYVVNSCVIMLFRIVKSAPKLFQSAEETRIHGDEEKSYILYMRYNKALQVIFKSRDYRNDKVS